MNSNMEMPMPDAAPDPASPMKWPEPMLLANREAPTWWFQLRNSLGHEVFQLTLTGMKCMLLEERK